MADRILWKTEHGVHSATVNGHKCRVVQYPDSSALAGRFGCYLDGQYKGVANTVDNAKSRCRSLSSFARTPREWANLRVWQPA
jgi:hypothetical protein